MFEYVADYDKTWNRTKKSVLSEWKIHALFAPLSDRAQNIDFDEAEEGANATYYVRKLRKTLRDKVKRVLK